MEAKGRKGVGWVIVLCAWAGVLLCVQTGNTQSFFPVPGSTRSDSALNMTTTRFLELVYGLGLTSANVGVYYGSGNVDVKHSSVPGATTALLYQDFSGFVHHRKTDLQDAYFSGSIGIGSYGGEFLCMDLMANLGRTTKFKQYTDAQSVSFPYLGALGGILTLNSGEEGSIKLDCKNRYYAFDVYGRIPLLNSFDILAGYKYFRVKSSIDPYSTDYSAVPPWSYLPALTGWFPGWADLALTSQTGFGMYQELSWQSGFLGAIWTYNPGGMDCSFDVRFYPLLFGNYKFSWDGAYFDPNLNLSPAVFGAQSSNISGGKRWALELALKGKFPLQSRGTLQLEARYLYASMSASSSQYQRSGNVYSGDPYWDQANFTQETPENVVISQNLLLLGGSLEFAF